jgi:hypothetical protein
MLSGLAELEERLERRRRRQGGRIRLIEHEALMMSDETTAFTLVERHVPLARICQDRPEALCIPVGARERRIGVCIDEVVPPAGASGLGAYEPSDLWLVEIYDNGRRIRAYSRWFVARMAREEGGLIPLTMTCR